MTAIALSLVLAVATAPPPPPPPKRTQSPVFSPEEPTESDTSPFDSPPGGTPSAPTSTSGEDSGPAPEPSEDRTSTIEAELLESARANYSRRERRRDWFLYHAFAACTAENDMTKCATYAAMALKEVPNDAEAKMLRSVAVRRGGVDMTRKKRKDRPRTGRSRRYSASNTSLGVNVLALLKKDAHGGVLVNPEFAYTAGRDKVVVQLGLGPTIGQVHFLRAESEEHTRRPGAMIAGGARLRYLIGLRLRPGRNSAFDIYAEASIGFLATSSSIVRRGFFHVIPSTGIRYSRPRWGIGVGVGGSWLAVGEDKPDKQGFGVGVLGGFHVAI